MKTVDENWKYDEQEGFEMFNPERQFLRDELLQMSIHNRNFIFSAEAVKALGEPEYILFYINTERKLLQVQASEASEDKALRIKSRCKSNKIKNTCESTKLVRIVEKMIGKDFTVIKPDL